VLVLKLVVQEVEVQFPEKKEGRMQERGRWTTLSFWELSRKVHLEIRFFSLFLIEELE
jgi:hypothetical protein